MYRLVSERCESSSEASLEYELKPPGRSNSSGLNWYAATGAVAAMWYAPPTAVSVVAGGQGRHDVPPAQPRLPGEVCTSSGTHGSRTARTAPGASTSVIIASRRPPERRTVTGNDCGLASATANENAGSSWLLGVCVAQYSHPRYPRAPSGTAHGSPHRPSVHRSPAASSHTARAAHPPPSSEHRSGCEGRSGLHRTAAGGHAAHPPATQNGRAPEQLGRYSRAPASVQR